MPLFCQDCPCGAELISYKISTLFPFWKRPACFYLLGNATWGSRNISLLVFPLNLRIFSPQVFSRKNNGNIPEIWVSANLLHLIIARTFLVLYFKKNLHIFKNIACIFVMMYKGKNNWYYWCKVLQVVIPSYMLYWASKKTKTKQTTKTQTNIFIAALF